MLELGELAPRWRTKCVENGFISQWDNEWFYHFLEGGFDCVEWLDVEVTSDAQERAVSAALTKIRVPGEKLCDGYRIYGYIPVGMPIDYL